MLFDIVNITDDTVRNTINSPYSLLGRVRFMLDRNISCKGISFDNLRYTSEADIECIMVMVEYLIRGRMPSWITVTNVDKNWEQAILAVFQERASFPPEIHLIQMPLSSILSFGNLQFRYHEKKKPSIFYKRQPGYLHSVEDIIFLEKEANHTALVDMALAFSTFSLVLWGDAERADLPLSFPPLDFLCAATYLGMTHDLVPKIYDALVEVRSVAAKWSNRVAVLQVVRDEEGEWTDPGDDLDSQIPLLQHFPKCRSASLYLTWPKRSSLDDAGSNQRLASDYKLPAGLEALWLEVQLCANRDICIHLARLRRWVIDQGQQKAKSRLAKVHLYADWTLLEDDHKGDLTAWREEIAGQPPVKVQPHFWCETKGSACEDPEGDFECYKLEELPVWQGRITCGLEQLQSALADIGATLHIDLPAPAYAQV